MKFPYGISDFDALITEKYYYVDRTDRIPLLEEAGDQCPEKPRLSGCN